MKTILITSLFAFAALATKAQTKPDTTRKPFTLTFTQNEVKGQFDALQFIGKRIHSIHIDALLRDSLDIQLSQSDRKSVV